jgi:hypothetical protein
LQSPQRLGILVGTDGELTGFFRLTVVILRRFGIDLMPG